VFLIIHLSGVDYPNQFPFQIALSRCVYEYLATVYPKQWQKKLSMQRMGGK